MTTVERKYSILKQSFSKLQLLVEQLEEKFDDNLQQSLLFKQYVSENDRHLFERRDNNYREVLSSMSIIKEEIARASDRNTSIHNLERTLISGLQHFELGNQECDESYEQIKTETPNVDTQHLLRNVSSTANSFLERKSCVVGRGRNRKKKFSKPENEDSEESVKLGDSSLIQVQNETEIKDKRKSIPFVTREILKQTKKLNTKPKIVSVIYKNVGNTTDVSPNRYNNHHVKPESRSEDSYVNWYLDINYRHSMYL